MENKYALLNYDHDALDEHMDANKDLDKFEAPEVEFVTAKIDALIANFKEGIDALAKKYPDAGIGDTATDECIAAGIYNNIH